MATKERFDPTFHEVDRNWSTETRKWIVANRPDVIATFDAMGSSGNDRMLAIAGLMAMAFHAGVAAQKGAMAPAEG